MKKVMVFLVALCMLFSFGFGVVGCQNGKNPCQYSSLLPVLVEAQARAQKAYDELVAQNQVNPNPDVVAALGIAKMALDFANAAVKIVCPDPVVVANVQTAVDNIQVTTVTMKKKGAWKVK
jgi:hypothetical protein